MKKISICASLLILVSCAYEPADELTVYTSRQPQLIEPIVEKFSLETGIKVNFLSGNAQELMERIDVEGENSPADIFMTVDAEFYGKQLREISLVVLIQRYWKKIYHHI